MSVKEKDQVEKHFFQQLEKNQDNRWDVLPCKGIFKLTSARENITFSYCDSDYWNCPNKNCIMNLV
ncbi:MAG: hypothetical protein D6767_03195 [Candidatus Hydrogenedentota bacterium]|nr:MAG: hypothetical protein D6767_03195 [Candidatus Hydrogenedentota bacterium]